MADLDVISAIHADISSVYVESSQMVDDAKGKKEVRFTAAPELWAYLGWLARNTLLGETENDVARHVLTQRLTELRQEDYKDPNRV